MSTVLVVDDDKFCRTQLSHTLEKLGHKVVTARDGEEAWGILQDKKINLLITDWIMPELNGPGLCKRIRAARLERYVYIIMHTSKKDKSDMLEGMDAGADDFISKPCLPQELQVKLRTGQRVLAYEQTLVERNAALVRAHQRITLGLQAVSDYHKTLLPPRSQVINRIHFQSHTEICEIASGDMINFFPLDDDHTVFYLLDVAGHGVPAAMLSFTLSHIISPLPGNERVYNEDSRGFLNLSSPVETAEALNKMFLTRSDDALSFTLIYGIINQREGRIRFVQAGHPPPIYIPYDGPARPVGTGGFPVGFFEEATYDEYFVDFKPGDRLLLYSDGVTECRNIHDKPYSLERLLGQVEKVRETALIDILSQVERDLERWRSSPELEDDWSLMAFEYLRDGK